MVSRCNRLELAAEGSASHDAVVRQAEASRLDRQEHAPGIVEIESPQVVGETGQAAADRGAERARRPDHELRVLALVDGTDQGEPRRLRHPPPAFGQPLEKVHAGVAAGVGVDARVFPAPGRAKMICLPDRSVSSRENNG